MKQLICPGCGSQEFKEENGFKICCYCESKFEIEKKPSTINTQISLENDVTRLLRKCKDDPANAKKYANLILDIDPCNEDALDYL